MAINMSTAENQLCQCDWQQKMCLSDGEQVLMVKINSVSTESCFIQISQNMHKILRISTTSRLQVLLSVVYSECRYLALYLNVKISFQWHARTWTRNFQQQKNTAAQAY